MLKLPKTKDRIALRGLHDLQGEECTYRALVELHDIHGRDQKISVDAVVANKVTSNLPQSSISEANQWAHLKGSSLPILASHSLVQLIFSLAVMCCLISTLTV